MPEKPVSAAKKIKEDKLVQGFGSMKIRMNDVRLFYWQEKINKIPENESAS